MSRGDDDTGTAWDEGRAFSDEAERRMARRSARDEAGRGPDRAEAERLIRDFLARGGQVKLCPPGDALASKGDAIAERIRRAERLAGLAPSERRGADLPPDVRS